MKIKYFLLLILIISIPLTSFLMNNLSFLGFYKIYAIYSTGYLLWFFLPILIIVYIVDLIKSKRKITKIEYITYLLILITIISSLNAINIKIAILGSFYRREGLITLLSYYFIFLNSLNLNKKQINNLIDIFILIGLLNIFYSFLQVYTNLLGIIRGSEYFRHMAAGLIGNANFLGSYLAMTGVLATVKYLESSKKFYFLSSLITFLGILMCQSSGPFISYAFIMLLLLIIKRKEYKKIFKLFTIFLVIFALHSTWSVYLYNKLNYKVIDSYTILGDIKQLTSLIIKNNNSSNNSNSNTVDKTTIASGRISIFESTYNISKKYPLLGTGPDCLGISYYEMYGSNLIDRSHNIYLHTLVTLGIFGLLFTLIQYGLIFKKSLKVDLTLSLAFIVYLLSGLLNVNTPEVMPTFYIICGMISLNRFEEIYEK